MANLGLWIHVFVISLSLCCIFAQDGRVFMNASRTAYNGNENTGNVNIFLILQGTRNESVEVTCQQSVQGSGYSGLEFTPVTIQTTTNSATMNFRISGVGRPVAVTCSGRSVGGTCPSAQFCPATSTSDPVTMVVYPPPTVSVCGSGPVLNANGGSFLVRFSPTVTEIRGSVSVSCRASPVPGVTTQNTTLNIPTVNRSSIEAFTVSYTVQQQGAPVEIMCSGQSQNSNQFQANTSSGGSGIFSFIFGALYMYPRISNIYSDSFKVFLVRDPQYTSTAPQMQCAAVRFDSLTSAIGELENPQCNSNQSQITTTLGTTISTSTPPTTTTAAPTTTPFDPNATPVATTPSTPPTSTLPPTPSPVLTSGWTVREADFTLEVGTVYRVLEVNRELPVAGAVTEFVVLRCCLSLVGNFNSSAVTALAVVDLQPDFCSNCTGGPAEIPLTDSRIIRNPAYQEVAPCPCNLQYRRCDINCCCDTDCTDENKLLFEFCIPGRAGGLPAPAPFYKCDSQPGVERPDWFLVLCAVYTTSGYLGLFQLDTPGLKTLANFNDRLTQQGPFYSYQEDERRMFSSGAGQGGYDSDTEIITSTHQGLQGIMALPQASASGQCVMAAPIEFLQNSSATCQVSVTPESCTANPLLNANSYAEPEITTNSGCPSAFYFLQQYGVVNATIGPSFVSYYCPTNLADYVKNTTESYNQVAGPTVSSTLSSVLAGENCTAPCGNANCTNANPDFAPGITTQPSLCSWSTTYTRPSPPTTSTTSCQNVVLGAHYVFTWLGRSLVRLDARIFLGEVPLGSALSQQFSVEFQHRVATPTQNLTDNFLDTSEPYARSGKPGYDYGKPIWSGCEENNQTTGQFLNVDTHSSKQMGLWQPGRDGLCANALRKPVTFGDDTLSACALRLTLPDFDDCNALRLLIFNHMNSLLPSDVLGRLGYNDANNRGYWVNVQRDAINVTFEEPLPENATELYRGSCSSIVSGIKLLVLFAETGKTNSYPINEIVGARISYEQSDWSLSCMGPNAVRCLNNTNHAESFLLTTAVQFIKVPATEPSPIIRFYTAPNPANCTFDSCYRFYEGFSTETCHYDICLVELAYPLTSSYTADSRIYSLGFTLATILVGIGYFFISRPWF